MLECVLGGAQHARDGDGVLQRRDARERLAQTRELDGLDLVDSAVDRVLHLLECQLRLVRRGGALHWQGELHVVQHNVLELLEQLLYKRRSVSAHERERETEIDREAA